MRNLQIIHGRKVILFQTRRGEHLAPAVSKYMSTAREKSSPHLEKVSGCVFLGDFSVSAGVAGT
jgi:hypothetical protein